MLSQMEAGKSGPSGHTESVNDIKIAVGAFNPETKIWTSGPLKGKSVEDYSDAMQQLEKTLK